MEAMTNEQFDNDELVLEKAFLRVLKRQSDTFIEYANTKGIDNALQALDSLIQYETFRTVYIKAFIVQGKGIARNTFTDLVKLSTKRQNPNNVTAGFFSELWQKFVVGYANTATVASRILKINETTKQNIREIFSKNPLSGASRVSLEIKRNIANINSTRALLIARTELTHINNTASQYGAEQAEQVTGVQLEKVWSARIDGRERPEHAQANGQSVPLKKNFVVGGVEMAHPGDPKGGAENVCNCRCFMTHRVSKRIQLPDLESVKPTAEDGNFISNLVAIAVGSEVLEAVEN